MDMFLVRCFPTTAVYGTAIFISPMRTRHDAFSCVATENL